MPYIIATVFFVLCSGANAQKKSALTPASRSLLHADKSDSVNVPKIGEEPYVLVLGTAQDAGLPQIGSHSPQSEIARQDPKRRRLVSSLLVVDPRSGKRWLIDATPDLREQVERSMNHPVNRKAGKGRPPIFEGVFLTHAHMGHYTGLLQFGREAHGSSGQNVYGSNLMCDFLKKNGPWSLLVDGGYIRLKEVQEDRPVQLAEGLSIVPIQVPHRAEFTDTLGFIIRGPKRSVLFIPDIDKWEKWDRSIEDLIARVDVALLDGTFFADGEIPGRPMADIPHPFIEESMKRFKKLPVEERRKIVFTHLNHTNAAADPQGEAAKKVRRAGMSIAREGQRIPLQ